MSTNKRGKKRKRKASLGKKRPKKSGRGSKEPPPNQKPTPKCGVTVDKSRVICRRYEEFHDHFLTYAKIEAFLSNIKKNYPASVDLLIMGTSGQGRSIYLVTITTDPKSSTEPKFATFIEAGLNGQDCFAVSNALYMIDYLVKNPCYARLMDYFIAPCGNPDAYDQFVRSKIPKDACACRKVDTPAKDKKPERTKDPCSNNPTKTTPRQSQENPVNMDLTLNFPVILGAHDMRSIPTDIFLAKIKTWKEHYIKASPETSALLRTIHSCLFAVKLIVCLREGGESVCYPYGFPGAVAENAEALKEVARKGKCAIAGRNFQFGSLYDLQGLTYGHLVDLLKLQRVTVKYMYNIQVHKKAVKYDEKAELKKLLTYGCQIMECVKRMSGAVFKACAPLGGKMATETVQ